VSLPRLVSSVGKWLGSHRVVGTFLGLNALLWLWCWSEVVRNAVPYRDHPPDYEELASGYKFGGRALPWDSDSRLSAFRVMNVAQRPTLFSLNRITGLFERDWSYRFGPLSVGAWVLVVSTFVSFGQWWVVAGAINLVFGGFGRLVHTSRGST